MGGGVMSTIKANQWLSSDGTENYKCKAFVNFNGTGTVAIRASGNVSSITDNGVGDYTVNFTTAMVDANYSLSTESSSASENRTIILTTSSTKIQLFTSTGSAADDPSVYFQSFR